MLKIHREKVGNSIALELRQRQMKSVPIIHSAIGTPSYVDKKAALELSCIVVRAYVGTPENLQYQQTKR